MINSSKPGVDTREFASVAGPLHVVPATRVTLPGNSPLMQPASYVAVTANSSLRPKLTLSAFRRPEHTVRLTRSDPTRVLEADYNLESPGCGILGHGAFSTVRLAHRKSDGLKVAVKSIQKWDALRARRLKRGGHCHLDEWEILEQFNYHPHIVTLLDLFETNEEVHLVTEYCNGGELFDAIQRKRNRSPSVRRGHYSEAQAACITRQLLTALRDLHAQGVLHRDVKPENIVLVENMLDDVSSIHVKLCDFGLARCVSKEGGSNSDTETPPSTPGRKHSFCAVSCDYYAAPEVCLAGSAHKPSADIYSLGCTLYILLCGFPPVVSEDLRDVERQDYVMFPKVPGFAISDGAKLLIRKMLHPDPSKRITAKDALLDEWIQMKGSQDRKSPPTKSKNTTSSARRPSPLFLRENPLTSDSDSPNDQVRNRLIQALSRLQDESRRASRRRRGSDVIFSPKRKRRRGSMECQRRSSIVCAMKELYCDVTSVSAAASAAADGVVCDEEKKDIRVFQSESEYVLSDDQDSSPRNFQKSPPVPLSV